MLEQLYVLIYLHEEWVPCGLLQFNESGRLSSSRFRYGIKYLERKDAIAIDPVQLPLKDTTFSTEDGFAVFNGIRDAGPDKWGRYLLDKRLARSLNEIEYLGATGDDRVGALAFTDNIKKGPRKLETNGTFSEIKSVKRLSVNVAMGAIDDAIAQEETERLRRYLDYGPSLGGARPKATVLWNKELYLAKFSVSLDTRNEPLIEYATMTLAKRCGLDVPDLNIQLVDGRHVFLIKRFDRSGDLRLPFVSGLTMTGIHESEYSSWSYLAVVDAITKFSSHHEKDLKELFRRMVFNIAVYNNDDHLRNFGFLGKANSWNLSPLYDVVPATINTNTYALAMTVGLEGKKASYSNALSMCERFRLNKEAAKNIIDDVKKGVSAWREHFKACGVSEKDISSLENSFFIKE